MHYLYYWTMLPGGRFSAGWRSTGWLSVSAASIMPWLTSPRILRGAMFIIKGISFPMRVETSGTTSAMPASICFCSEPKSTIILISLSESGIRSAEMTLPIRMSNFLKSSKVIMNYIFAEAERFELSVGFPTPPFQDGALDRYATPPTPLIYIILAKKKAQFPKSV